jgi:hypothetical protein
MLKRNLSTHMAVNRDGSVVEFYKEPGMSRWRYPKDEALEDKADRMENRVMVAGLLNGTGPTPYTLPEGFEGSDELAVFVTRRFKYTDEERRKLSWGTPTWVRVARSYGRKVVWFKGDEDDVLTSGELVCVGDAGKGRGWPDRMARLFQEAVQAWTAHRTKNGWRA